MNSSPVTNENTRSRAEFIALMACLSALDALAIDSMLPALRFIGQDLSVTGANSRQFVVTTIFLGFGLGLFAYGVLGDALGRRRPVIAGIIIYLVGTMICVGAQSLPVLLAGRVLQGFGAAGPYVLGLAIVRDTFSGREMATVMSLIMMIFMIVPALAPILGQAILMSTGNWRYIFAMLAIFALLTLVWFATRQPETLRAHQRMKLAFKPIATSTRIVLSTRSTMMLTLAQGVIMGAFIGFLSTSQQILQEIYALGDQFALYFALLALTLGIAAFFNSRWVQQLGALRLVNIALVVVALASLCFGTAHISLANGLTLTGFMPYMMIVYACCGLLFGNLASMAMEPMGEVAGIASSIIGCIGTLMAFVIGATIGSQLHDSAMPVIIGFGICSLSCMALVWNARVSAD